MPCPGCNDAGFVPSAHRASGAVIRAALDDGAIVLCGCPQGQWWLSMIYDSYGPLYGRDGVTVVDGDPHFRQTRGVPPGMLHGDDAIAWLHKYAATAMATAPRLEAVSGGARR